MSDQVTPNQEWEHQEHPSLSPPGSEPGVENQQSPRRVQQLQRGPPPGYGEQPEQPAQGSSQAQTPLSPPGYTSQEPEVQPQEHAEEPPLFQTQVTPKTVQEAIDYLDKIPHQDWGTVDQKAQVVVLCNIWRDRNPGVDSWLAHNILMMEEDVFKAIVSDGNMVGPYRFCAYVRMQNWAFWSDEQKRVVMELGDLSPPESPEVPSLDWFTQDRADHQFFDVTEERAKEFLDQDTEETQHLFDAFGASFDWTAEAMHWMAANILHMNSEPVIKDDWAMKRAKKPAKRRMRNWMRLHVSWHGEFLNLALIPFTRKPVKWDPNQKARLDCLQDPPSANRHLESTMDQFLAHAYLFQESACSFSEEQTEFLFNMWMRNNPKYRVWAENFIVPKYIKMKLNRMRNWLIMDAGWKRNFIEKFLPRKFDK